MPRPRLQPCNALGGRSPLTGARVGTRHRWPEGWGQGACLYCHHTLAQARGETVAPSAVEPPATAAEHSPPRRRCADLLAWRRRARARAAVARLQERVQWSRAAGI